MNASPRTLVIIDDQLEKIEGHPYEYNKAVGALFGTKDWTVDMYGDSTIAREIRAELHAKPWFVFNPAARIRNLPIAGPVLYRLGYWRAYEKQMTALLEKVSAEYEHPLVFVPNAYWYNIRPIARSLRKTRMPAAVLYRTSIFDTIRVPRLMKRLILPLIRNAVKEVKGNPNVHFFSDSDVIAGEWEKEFGLPMQVLPIPHLVANKKDEPPGPGEKIRFYLPGGMRLEKGAEVLTQALEHLAAQRPQILQRMTLVTQYFGSDSLIDGFKARLAAVPVQNIFLASLDTNAYNAQLRQADVILIPYQASEGYRARTSGILAEAIASAKPFITTAGTWMSVQAQKFHTGVVIQDRDPESLAAAISALTEDYEAHALRAAKAVQAWMQSQSGETFFRTLTSAAAPRPAQGADSVR